MSIKLYNTSDFDILAALQTLFSLFVACKIIELVCHVYRKAIYEEKMEMQKVILQRVTTSTQFPETTIKPISTDRPLENDVILFQNSSTECESIDQQLPQELLRINKKNPLLINLDIDTFDNCLPRANTLPLAHEFRGIYRKRMIQNSKRQPIEVY